jgi:hypothetical protein
MTLAKAQRRKGREEVRKSKKRILFRFFLRVFASLREQFLPSPSPSPRLINAQTPELFADAASERLVAGGVGDAGGQDDDE